MILKDFAPHPSLNEFVQCYRIVHFDFAPATEPVLKAYAPRPEVCLHFFLRETERVQFGSGQVKDHRFPVVLAGQQTAVFNRYLVGRDFRTFNIVFQPTALFQLTGISSFELKDQYLDAETIFSSNVRLILEQFQHAASYQEMITIADRFVTSLVNKCRKEVHQLDTVSRLMIRSGGKLSLDWLAKESYLSPKQFKRKFYERTGLNPKTYLRIIRFNKAFNIRNAYPRWDWLRIALECDYYDYQHMVRDYTEFTRQTPTEFHRLESNSPERMLGIAADIYKSRAALAVVNV